MHIINVLFLFRLLNEAQGSLLDDEKLVTTLQKSQVTAKEVAEQLQSSEQNEIITDGQRKVILTLVL